MERNFSSRAFGQISQIPGAVTRKRFPDFFEPELATLVDSIPGSSDWIHEIKFDGYRLLTFIENGDIRFFSRNGVEWTKKLSGLKPFFKSYPARNAILDGELVYLDDEGKSDFQSLQNSLKHYDGEDLYYYVFDITYLNGFDLKPTPLLHRRQVLTKLFSEFKSDIIRLSPTINGSSAEIIRNACEFALEGIISKKIKSTYQSGRGKDWVKTKCLKRQEFIIVGYTEPQGSRKGFGSLLLGAYDEKNKLRYAGRVGTGFSSAFIMELWKKLSQLEISAAAVDPAPKKELVHWVKPQLICEVKFTEWTSDRILRHPSFVAMRIDKRPKQVRFEG